MAAVVLGARTRTQIVERTGLGEAQVTSSLTRLVRGRIVTSDADGFTVREEVFGDAARADAPKPPAEDFGSSDPATTKVLRAFLRHRRLVSIPAAGRKRAIVLEYLSSTFEPGRRYPEAEVNALLRSFHDDTAALRRYLVEGGDLTRDHGEYWRSGGWVDVQ